MAAYSAHTDQELTVLLKKDDRTAFAEIYERYWALLLRHALGMLHQQDEAKDVIQDVFQMLWEKRAILEIHTSLSAFLYVAVRNRVLKQFRHGKVAESYLATLQSLMETGIASTDQHIEVKELTKQIEAGLNKLPKKMREVFELSRLHQYSYRQISEELDLSDNTVKRQISNALKILRESINRGLIFFF
jgi:RNA polymerase sigma-70 factor (ECF subfamily)